MKKPARSKSADKNALNYPKIVGFEKFPLGKLLTQKVDFDGPVGIAYERCIGYTKPDHSHDRMTITFPRGASRSFIKILPESKTFSLDEAQVHLMSKDHQHEQGSVSSVYDVFAIFIEEDFYLKFLESRGVKLAQALDFLRSTDAYPRGPFLTELVNRYFFARVLSAEPSAMELKYLEESIMIELFTLAKARLFPIEKPKPVISEQTALARALEFIESNLFEKLDVPALVKTSRASQATLFRLFKKELGVSPLEYVRNRRMDEARSLLEGGQYQVSDVCLLVGYNELSSFSRAFKARFGKPPSTSLTDS